MASVHPVLMFLVLLPLLALPVLTEVSGQDEEPTADCFSCIFAIKEGEKSGSPTCRDPFTYGVRHEPCSGPCYVVNVHDEEAEIDYVQRGCLPGCRHNHDYKVLEYGTGSIECCLGHLCNASPPSVGTLGVLVTMIVTLVASMLVTL